MIEIEPFLCLKRFPETTKSSYSQNVMDMDIKIFRFKFRLIQASFLGSKVL